MKFSKIRTITLLTLALTVTFMSGFSYSNQKKIFSQEEVISLIRDYDDPNTIYAASKETVYKTMDNGKHWDKIFSIKEAGKKINKIYAEPKTSDNIYVLTQGGLFQSKDKGANWQSLFKGSSDLENNCFSILETTTVIFLGAEEGLFMSNNQGKTWQKSSDQFSGSIISAIVANPHNEDVIYVACEKGVYVSENNGTDWRRIYVAYGSEVPSEDYGDYDGEVSEQFIGIKNMVISDEKPNKLYILTTQGVFSTDNIGKDWKSLTKIGLTSSNIRSMVISDKDKLLYVATDKGIFSFNGKRWERVGNSLSSRDFDDLVIDEDGGLVIAGKRGVFSLGAEDDQAKSNEVDYSKEDLEYLFAGEPTIEQVQKAAIEYADVNMKKIKSWQRQSRLKALMPDFSVGYDKIIYGSSSGAMAVGPRDWDMSLSWDLADLIWSTDQTTIDSRSRLTVQLRQDVLSQVTNLFYERQRIKAELMLSPSEDPVEELYRNFELKQITADIDALTNGYFSRSLRNKKGDRLLF